MNSEQERMIAMAGFSGSQMQGLMQGIDQPPAENPARELFGDEGDVRGRSDLTKDEISAITLLRHYGKLTGDARNVNRILNDFMHLQASKDRKSRKEFVQAITGADPYARQGNMFSRMFQR